MPDRRTPSEPSTRPLAAAPRPRRARTPAPAEASAPAKLAPKKPAQRRARVVPEPDVTAVPDAHDAPQVASSASPLVAALTGAADAARTALAAEDHVTAVHDVRRALKHARALLALIRGRHGGAARRLRRELGASARTLAGTRDAHIIADALADLAAHRQQSGLAAALGEELAGALAGPQATTEAGDGLAALDAIPARIADATKLAGDMAEDALPKALAASYRRARRAARRIDPHDAVALHELRKDVVAHRYQMELAAPWWPKLGTVWLGELQKLRDSLGKHHDLEILLARLDAGPDLLPEHIAAAMDAVSLRQRALAAKALRRHARLFAERPKAFRRRLDAYLELAKNTQ